jgi:S1-C subfamily serine protease
MKEWFKKHGRKIVIVIYVILVLLISVPVVKNGLQDVTFTHTIQKSIKSVVHVSCPGWQGSGFVIDKHIIATARHIVENVESFDITFSDGNKIHATKAVSDKEHDVGFIWIEEELPYNVIAKLGSIKNCVLGEDLYIIGSPYGKINFNSVTKGIVSGIDRNWDEIDPYTNKKYGWEVAFTSDSAVHPGNSGCPVFTMDGVVRGIVVGMFSPVLNCSMPCDLFLNDVDTIRQMFLMNKYQVEKIAVTGSIYYNYENDTDYYEVE